MHVSLYEIPGAIASSRVDWETVNEWVELHVSEEDCQRVWYDLACEWFDILDAEFGFQYRAVQTENLLLFAPKSFTETRALLGAAEKGLKQITIALGPMSRKRWQGLLVVLLFSNHKSYSRYLCLASGITEESNTAGVCFKGGFVHIALRPAPLDGLHQVMQHEITHACLSHLELPLWLEEGVAQLAEEDACPDWARFTLTPKDAEEIRKYWQRHDLNKFWWGSSFLSDGEEQKNSYELARILFTLVREDYRHYVAEFVRRASANDAGERAAQVVLGKSLSEIAGHFLGRGNWGPVPPRSEK